MGDKNGARRKVCPKCGHEGPIEKDFGLRSVSGKTYAQSQCRACRSGKVREPGVAEQTCSGPCGKDKPATKEFFPVSRFNESGIRTECRECKNRKVREQRARRST
jgi:hypothetical protein